MSWNPVLGDEKLRGLDRMTRPTAAPGEIVVLLGRQGVGYVLEPGTAPTSGEMRVRSFQRAVRLTASPHRQEHDFELQSADTGVLFQLHVSMDVRVEPAVAAAAAKAFAVESGSADQLVGQRVRALAAPVCSSHNGADAHLAQAELLAHLREQLDLSEWGLAAHDIAIQLRLPSDLEEEIGRRHVDEQTRENERASQTHQQDIDAKRREFERAESALDYEAKAEQERLQAHATDEAERIAHARELDFTEDEETQRTELERQKRLTEIDLDEKEYTSAVNRRLEAIRAAKELGSLSDAELNRLYVLENADATRQILGARTRRINADAERDHELLARNYELARELIASGELDLRREEDREIINQLTTGSHSSSRSDTPQIGDFPLAAEVGAGDTEVEIDDIEVEIDDVEVETTEAEVPETGGADETIGAESGDAGVGSAGMDSEEVDITIDDHEDLRPAAAELDDSGDDRG